MSIFTTARVTGQSPDIADPLRETLSNYPRPTDDLLDLFAGSDANPRVRERIRERLDKARQIDLDAATIVIASWENPLAGAGGVRAVTQKYAEQLTSEKRTVLVVTPLHTGLQTPPGAASLSSVLWFDFEEERRRVEIFESEWAAVRWVFVHCDSFFCAEGGRDRTSPYLYEDDDTGASVANASPRLVRDCLFYAAVLPKVLAGLHITDNVIFHLQDWETIGVALSVKSAVRHGKINRAVCVLALHNPYDKYLDLNGWAQLTDRPAPANTPPTFLGRLLPFLDAPPVTVSREFAIDLVTDPLQTTHLADHLQVQFKRFGIAGVDNGQFLRVPPPFSPQAIAEARMGRPEQILKEKQKLRDAMIGKMKEYKPAERWGNVNFEELKEDVPVFMCIGRLDPGQKGFDVAARAIEAVLGQRLNACFVLTAILGNAPQPFVDDLRTLATNEAYEGHVVVYPFQMQEGFLEIQAGCTFSFWPSMYEPFGGVSEFLLRGTPVVARSTGGLRQQVVNFDRETGEGNGILYETTVPQPDDSEWFKGEWCKEWRIIQRGTPTDRITRSLYRDQVDKLAGSIQSAVEIFSDHAAYGRLLSNVPGSVDGYSWERAAQEYSLLYAAARHTTGIAV